MPNELHSQQTPKYKLNVSPPPDEYPKHEGIDPDSIMRIDTLCHSLCGNPIFTLTITNDIDSYLSSE